MLRQKLAEIETEIVCEARDVTIPLLAACSYAPIGAPFVERESTAGYCGPKKRSATSESDPSKKCGLSLLTEIDERPVWAFGKRVHGNG